MNSKTVLLTSFTTWEAHQRSNSADDLLLELQRRDPLPSWRFLRQLPVDVQHAPQQTIAHINQVRPDVVINYGMAEQRTQLQMESRAVGETEVLYTPFHLESLVEGLTITSISHDAGRFVCNSLYYAILKHLQTHLPDVRGLFIHVPILTIDNLEAIVTDAQTILHRCGQN